MVQPVSVDEAFLQYPNTIDPYLTANELRKSILEKTGCPSSVGIGNNMLIARLATKKVVN